MKAIYKLMFWFIFFESTIVLVSFIDVFPADAMFFSDFEMETMQQHLVGMETMLVLLDICLNHQ